MERDCNELEFGEQENVCLDFISSITANQKETAWEDNNDAIVNEQETQYELLDVEDEKFYRGNNLYDFCVSNPYILFYTEIWNNIFLTTK